MDNENSGQGITFDVNLAESDASEQNETLPVEGAKSRKGRSASQNMNEESKPLATTANKDDSTKLYEPYTDIRKITISLVRNYSLYRKANDKVLPKRQDFIGSSVISSRTLASNKEEVDAYFPSLVGVSPNDPSFLMRVKQYLNNIKVGVDELGKTFDVSFHYNNYKDYLNFKQWETELEERYAKVSRSDLKALKAALKDYLYNLNLLESSKHKYGYPINLEDYIIYRHCLLYNDVAKDMALINSDPNIRFYFRDESKEAKKKQEYRKQVNRSRTNFVKCLEDETIFDMVYIQYLSYKGLPIVASLAKDKVEKENELDRFSTEEPIRFNEIFADKDKTTKSTIELLIARGELVRYTHNQNIVTADGEFVGGNMKEAVAYFNNPENSSIVNALYNKLKKI